MDHEDKAKLTYTTAGAWLGLMAYLLLIVLVLLIFILG